MPPLASESRSAKAEGLGGEPKPADSSSVEGCPSWPGEIVVDTFDRFSAK